ncbi:MAG: IgGFc-binding protein [Myxococcales bacterium]|nr:IgGFc-binding protein [Myxococcales bacterium]
MKTRRTAAWRLLAALTTLAACSDPERTVQDSGRIVAPDTGRPVDPRLWINCQPGQERCFNATVHQACREAGEFTQVVEDNCGARGLVCVEGRRCVLCRPNETRCTDDTLGVERCNAEGTAWLPDRQCNVAGGEACRRGICVQLCNDDSVAQSYIGCEYYGVDLDNIVETGGRSAASQQYAIVVSNPDPYLTVRVEVHRNNAPPGQPASLERVASAVIPPRDLEVFSLPAREVDCSSVAGLNDGTGTCLSSRAYRVTSNFPVVAYQFNPLENVGVFSNDASLLLPTNSLQGNYRVIGYPQQWSRTSDPDTNGREEIRSFMTIVGTQTATRVRIEATADIIPGGPIMNRVAAGTPLEITLSPFDVLNLETGAFLADFTGSTVAADRPVAVFTGTECSDVPFWRTFADRQAACDHIEEQNIPLNAAGQVYVASRSPSRSSALLQAGARVAEVNEPEWFRVLNVSSAPVHVTTTLPEDIANPAGPKVEFDLDEGEYRDLRALADFIIRGSGAVQVAQYMGSQSTTGIPTALPGGDPALLMVPPLTQWRQDYVFLTPNKYSFDFVQIVARPDQEVFLDETPVRDFADCRMSRSDGCIENPRNMCPPAQYVTYRCQLSFPQIDNSQNPVQISAGRQADGVHVVRAVTPEGRPPEGVMVLVTGFDRFVSYGYAGGTNLVPVR